MEIDYENTDKIYINILKGIFKFSEEEKKFYPILNENQKENILNFFEYLSNENNAQIENCLKIIFNLFTSSLETAIIITNSLDFEKKRNYNILNLLIDLYMKTEKNNIQEITTQIFSFLLKNIELKRKIYDYHLNKLLKDYKSQNLSSNQFIKYLKFLLILYGYNNNYETIQPKNYFYFTKKPHSGIEISIPIKKNVFLINGFSLVIWFNIDKYIIQSSIIIEFILNDNQQILIYLNEKNELGIKINFEDLNINIPIEKGRWIQMEFSLINLKNNKKQEIDLCLRENQFEKYHIKKILNNLKLKNNIELTSIHFFENFLGKFTTIIFYSIDNSWKENIFLNYEYGIYTKKQLIEFINKNEFKIKSYLPITFIITPISFESNNNIIIDPINRIKGEYTKIGNQKTYHNFVKIYHNSSKNIYKLGGINILLPIFEMVYKSFQNKECFNQCIFILYYIIKKKKKNVIDSLKSYFFPLLSLFLERIDNSLYSIDTIEKFFEIGLNIIKLNYQVSFQKKEFTNKILFNLKLLKKYTPDLLNKLWELTYKNIDLMIEYLPNLTTLLPFLIEYTRNNKFTLNLFEILKKVIMNSKDLDRCNFFKILSFENISMDLIIKIIDLFYYYFKTECNCKLIQKESTLFYLLKNNCLNELIFVLSSNNFTLKKKLIEFIYFLICNFYYKIKESLQILLKDNEIKFNLNEILELLKYNIIINEVNENNKSFELKSSFFSNNLMSKSRMSEFIDLKDYIFSQSSEEHFSEKKTRTNLNLNVEIISQKKKLIMKNKIQSKKILNIEKSEIKNNISDDLSYIKNININLLSDSQSFNSENEKSSNQFLDLTFPESEINKDRNDNNPLSSNNKVILKNEFYEKNNDLNKNNNRKILNTNISKSQSNKSLSKIRLNEYNNIKNIKNNLNIPSKKTKSGKVGFINLSLENQNKKNFKRELNISLNNENKIKLLTPHCINYYNGIDNDEICKKEIFNSYNNSYFKEYLYKDKFNNIKEYKYEKDNANKNYLNNINNDINNNSINEELKEEFEKNNLEICQILCQMLHANIKFNKDMKKDNLFIGDYSIYKSYIIDFILFQLKNLKNLKLIINALSSFILNKPKVKINDFEEIIECIWANDIKIYSEKKDFIDFIVDIMLSCYLDSNINDFKSNLIYENKIQNKGMILEGYFKSRELFIEIYMYNLNQINNSNDLISNLFSYVLNFQQNNTLNKNRKYNNYLYNFLRDIFTTIIDKFCQTYKNIEIKLSNIWINFIQLMSLYFEFSFLFRNAENIYDSKSNFLEKKEKYISEIPLFIYNGAFFNIINENYLWSDYYNYEKLFYIIKNLFSRKIIFDLCEIKTENTINENKIYLLSMNEINKIINYFIETKDNLNKLKSRFELLLISYSKNFKDCKNQKYYIPLINSITILISYIINLMINKENEYNNLIFWLNEYQFYIILILLGCCIKKDKKNFFEKYDNSIYIYLYYNLAFNIGFIFKLFYEEKNIEIKKLYHIIIKNISRIFSKILTLYEQTKSYFHFFKKKVEINENTCIVLLNQDYIISNKNDVSDKNEVNSENYNNEVELKSIFCKTDFNSDDYMSIQYLEENKNEFISVLLENKNIIKYSNILFNTQMYFDIYHFRFQEKNNIKSIFNDENYFEYSSSYIKSYRILYENICQDKNNLNFNIYNKEENKNFINYLFTKKNLRKVKKELFTWNNTYSDFDIFYLYHKKNLKYKLLYHLTKDLINPILTPILDFEYYFPTFSKYNKENIFQEEYRNYYNIDLKIFPKEIPSLPIIEPNNFECCYVTQTHHIKGIIQIQNNIQFIPIFSIEENELYKDKVEEYQEEKKNCYGSIFKTNNNYKDFELIRIIHFHHISFLFKRKYFYRDNCIEIFTTSNKSFFFKFQNDIIRDNFIEKILKNNFIFSEIKSIKKKIIGYYNNNIIQNNKLVNIDKISQYWKKWEISNLEFLMWINFFGNRSYRDLYQYPILPWPIINYSTDTNEFDDLLKLDNNNNNLLFNYSNKINNHLISNYKRDFNIPIGLMTISNDSIKRKKLYFETFKLMSIELKEETDLAININELDEIYKNNMNKNQIEIKNYGISLEGLYKDTNINYEIIPYFYGSHFSNATYISHYLVRLFPFCLTAIEIQVNNFDAPDRLFIDLFKSFFSVSSEKCDLRELIPEFFSLPEMFKNINKLNLGYLQNLNNEVNVEKLRVKNVLLPKWSRNNNKIFTMKMREILENENLNINNWIDLIFGINQRGKYALKKGNIYHPYCYDGVMGPRIDLYKEKNQISDVKCIMSLYELGIHPIKVFNNEIKRFEKKKNKNNIFYNTFYSNLNNYNKETIFISTFDDKSYNGIESLCILFDDFEIIKVNFIEYKDKLNSNTKAFSQILSFEKKTLYKNLFVLSLKNNSFFIITGFINGDIYFLKINEDFNIKRQNYNYNKVEIRNGNPLISKKDNSIITCIEIDKEEEFIYAGTEIGSIIIFKFINSMIQFFAIKNNHTDRINYINSNVRLNMFIDCSSDGYINLYIMPKVQLVRSLYNDYSYGIFIDFVFLSSSPLPSFTLHSNKNSFICYSINGDKLDIVKEKNIEENPFIISPIVYYNHDFMDYLIYGTGNNYLRIRKFPYMNLIYEIKVEQNDLNNQSFYFDHPIKFIQISKNQLFIYILFERSNIINIISLKIG